MSFIWTKMHADAGLSLAEIVRQKEAERRAGSGQFWWGIGQRINQDALRQAAEFENGRLPILFSRMIASAKRIDTHPDKVLLWRGWIDPEDKDSINPIPRHVLETSRGSGKKPHYALVCHSSAPLAVKDHGAFDPKQCRQEPSGKSPDSRQVTVLLHGNVEDRHSGGSYREGFQATLVKPWLVELTDSRPLDDDDRQLQKNWDEEKWQAFVDRLRGGSAN